MHASNGRTVRRTTGMRPANGRRIFAAGLVLAATFAHHRMPARADIGCEFVLVGSPGNAADTTGYGRVDAWYLIGKYEVTIAQYAAFLNAVVSGIIASCSISRDTWRRAGRRSRSGWRRRCRRPANGRPRLATPCATPC